MKTILLGALTIIILLTLSYYFGDFLLVTFDMGVNFERGDVSSTTLMGMMLVILFALFLGLCYCVGKMIKLLTKTRKSCGQ